MKFLLVIFVVGLFAGCALPRSPWLQSTEAERELAKIAASAAWRLPGFLEEPQRLVRMPLHKQLQDLELTWHAVKNRGYTFARLYVVQDSTSLTEPNLKHMVVLLRHGESEEAIAEVISGVDFFPRIFQCLGQNDPPREDAFDICRLYIRVFGNPVPVFSQPEILFSSADIPIESGEPIPKEIAGRIKPPLTQYFPPSRTNGGRLVSRFNLDCYTWDRWLGTLKRWRFDLRFDLGEWQQSIASVSESTIGNVGSGSAPK